jgi:hypothetical protein
VLVNVYGPAISTEERAEERYAFKLRFYQARMRQPSLSMTCETKVLDARSVPTRVISQGLISRVKFRTEKNIKRRASPHGCVSPSLPNDALFVSSWLVLQEAGTQAASPCLANTCSARWADERRYRPHTCRSLHGVLA